ncbi:MAG TPA: cytochrome c [Arthrobacter sp.]|nr:cytochrome c [Arthrobacter sp.]
MRAKTLGIFLLIGFALFTAVYWLTDELRRDTAFATQQEELLEYGHELFGPPTPEIPVTANCANCHGADGTGGEVGDTGQQAPNLHSRTIFEKLKVNPEYVNLVIRFGGVVVSGRVESPMPAWSSEVGGPLTIQQVDALTALVESWAAEAGEAPLEEVPNTPEAGREVYDAAGCAGCHGGDLAGSPGVFPSLQNIGNEPVVDLPTPISQLDQLVADYEEDPRNMLNLWIRDSAANYNDGTGTGMPPHPEASLSESSMEALITFLLEQKQ